MAELIDKTYGEALFQLSLEEGKVEEYADEVRSIKEAIAENPEFMDFTGPSSDYEGRESGSYEKLSGWQSL